MNRTMFLIFVTVTMGLTLLAFTVDPQPRTQPATASEEAALRAVLTSQQKAWNEGDVVAFMRGYWNSPDLTFSGANGITRGYATVLEHYKKNYPDPAAMGQLEFTTLEVHSLGKDAALVLGKWHLARQAGDVGGVFSLVFQRFPEGWKIVHDHTSVTAPAKL